jgi:hypothetical protein
LISGFIHGKRFERTSSQIAKHFLAFFIKDTT